jgi:DNA-binding CsgD family transcriptional regulator
VYENSRRLDLEIRFNSLTPRQREVFALITAGFLNKQVAAELRISERTVKVHRERLRRKMGVDSLAELSRMAELLRVRRLYCVIRPPELTNHRNGILLIALFVMRGLSPLALSGA